MRTEKGDRHEAERSCARKGFKETERKRKLKVEGGEKKTERVCTRRLAYN